MPDAPKGPDYADLDVPEWLSDWADDVCYKAPYPDHGYAPTQRVTGYVRWLEARVFVDYTDTDEESAMANARISDLEAALAESRGEATKLRDAVSDIFAKANDDHWSNAAAVKWISTRCLDTLEAPHEST